VVICCYVARSNLPRCALPLCSAGLEAYRSRSNFNTIVESFNDTLPISDGDRLAQPSVYELTTFGYSLSKALSKLDSAPGRLPPLVEGVAVPKLVSSDPLPLVCTSLERWSLVSGTRLCLVAPAPVSETLPAPGSVEPQAVEGSSGQGSAETPPVVFEIPQDRNVDIPYKHMFTTLEDRAAALEGRLSEMADAIVDAYGLKDLFVPVGSVSQVWHRGVL
jgi:hypothetical protein